ncbi:nuclear transport factor 2 family protein [Shewanella nanhaiensis]|uniref:Nuclear transport factor 2 family protein n=1 Tax=Shewanella nanhaiensis TaxID=2864872 RepID=A0ABS7E737_9GAMM|nr:nuclear transport factor 2 family protein [Shewanella nanhaiensis]MBW8185498.1 nuclear transport factor 2 family protein [Shewanella nanhaiensis]
MKKSIIAAASAVIVSTAAFADTPKGVAVAEMASLFKDFDKVQAAATMAPDLIQHNQAVPNGAAVLIDLIPTLKESGISATTHRLISEGNMVVAHNEYKNAKVFGGDHLAAFDVFRIEDGKVAEHWDNLTPVTAPNPSGRTQFDGTTLVTDLDKTAENKAVVTSFVYDVLHGKAPDKITDYVSTETYLQHNSGVADGLDGLGAALKAMADAGLSMTYSDTHMIIAEGNFVFTASEGEFSGDHVAFYDLFRVDGGKIVEHWDVIQTISEQSANDSGKF